MLSSGALYGSGAFWSSFKVLVMWVIVEGCEFRLKVILFHDSEIFVNSCEMGFSWPLSSLLD